MPQVCPTIFSSSPFAPATVVPLSLETHSLRLFLASASPRRAQLLQTLGVPFTLAAVAFDEPPPNADDHAAPALYVERLAHAKAAHCDAASCDIEVPISNPTDALSNPTDALILAADTIVWHGGRILGKPRDEEHAREMLRCLRGQTHQVFTGVCLRRGAEYHVAHQMTIVQFTRVSDDWIARYVATGEPMDKAGAYAAQGRGALLIERIEGDFWNVVGLPLATLGRLLETVGAPIEMWWGQSSQ